MATLVEAGLANALVAGVLALVALLVGAFSRRPALIHALWLLVLIKLVTPPLFRLPVPGLYEPPAVEAPTRPAPPVLARLALPPEPAPALPPPMMPFNRIGEIGPLDARPAMKAPPAAPVAADVEPTPDDEGDEDDVPEPPKPAPASLGTVGLIGVVWLAGAGLWFALAAWRIWTFHRLLRHAKPAPPIVTAEVQALAKQMGLWRVPTVWMLPGSLPPLLWSLGPARLYLPTALMSRLEEPGRLAMLVHELAHLVRRDHWARWVELCATCLYWWFPVVWFARARLHEAEEECCDAHVLSELPGYGAAYAGALLETVDFLARHPAPLPDVASGFGRMHHLKRRLAAIVQSNVPPRVPAMGWALVAALALVLPLGLARSAAPPGEKKEAKGEEQPPAKKPEEKKKEETPPPPRNLPRDPPTYQDASRVLGGGGGQVWAVALSPDEKVLAVVTGGTEGEGALTLFEYPSGKEIACIVEEKPIRCVAFSPDGKRLATGDFANGLKLRDPRTGAVRSELKGHTASVNAVAFTGDSKQLISGSLDKTVKVWDVHTGKNTRTMEGHSDWVLSVAVSKDGKTVVSGSKDMTARVWNATTGVMVRELKGHTTWVEGVALSPDGKRIATASHDNLIKLWDADSGKLVTDLTGHRGIVNTVLFSADGKKLYSCSHDLSVRVWTADGAAEDVFENAHAERIYGLAVTKDGAQIVSGSWDRTTKLHDVTSREVIERIQPRRYRPETEFPIFAVSVSPDGKRLAVCGEERLVKVIDAATGRTVHLLEGHEDVVGRAVFSPDGKTLATAGFDGDVILWDVETGKLRQKLQGHTNWVFCVAFSPDGSQLASSGYDRSVRLWDVKTGKPIVTLLRHKGGVRSVAFSPKGGILASAGTDRSVRIWDLAKKEEVQALKGHEDAVRCVCFTPDGERLASAGEDGAIRLWELSSGKQVAEVKVGGLNLGEGVPNSILSLAFSPRGTLLIAGDQSRGVRVLNAATLVHRTQFTRHTDAVTAVAVSPDGQTLYTASLDRGVRAWPAAAHRLRPTVRLDAGGGKQMWFHLFSPDGKWIATGGEPKTLTVRSAQAGGRLLAKMSGQVAPIYSSALSPDGKLLALSQEDGGTILIVDPATLERKKKLEGHKFPVWSLAWSPDGKKLVSGAGKSQDANEPGEAKVWDVEGGKVVLEIDGNSAPVQSVAWSPDGKWIAVSARDASLRLLDAATGKDRFDLKGHKEGVRRIAFRHDSKAMATCSLDGNAILFDVETGKSLGEVKGPASGIGSLEFSPNGKILAASSLGAGRVTNGEVWFFRRDEKGEYKQGEVLKGHTQPVLCLAFSRDGKSLASGAGTVNSPVEVIVWDVPTGKARMTLMAHNQRVLTLNFDATGEKLITAGGSREGGEAFLWNVGPSGGWEVANAHTAQITCAAWSPDSKLLVTGGLDRCLRVWDVSSGKMISQWKDVHKGMLRSIAFSRSGKRLVTTAADARVKVWDFETRELDRELDGFEAMTMRAVFSPDDRLLAVATGDPTNKVKTGSVHVYDTATWEEKAGAEWAKQQALSVAFSPDGTKLAAGGWGTDSLHVYDVASGKRLRQFKGPSSIRCVSWSADGRLLAAGQGNGMITLWDAESGSQEAELSGHTKSVLGLAFGPDGRLGSASNDGLVMVWGPVRSNQ